MSVRNFTTIMDVSGRQTGTSYFADIQFDNPVNEVDLTDKLSERVLRLAKTLGGTLTSRVKTYPLPNQLQINESYEFLNKQALFSFSQGVGLPQGTRGIIFRPDFQSLQSIL